jgi:hypothetical protein
MRQTRARFRGHCTACGGVIAIGTTIAIDPATKRVFHVRCSVTPARPAAPVATLPDRSGDTDLVSVPLMIPADDEPPRPGETMATEADGPVRVLRSRLLPATPGAPRLAVIIGRRSATSGPRRRWRDITDD